MNLVIMSLYNFKPKITPGQKQIHFNRCPKNQLLCDSSINFIKISVYGFQYIQTLTFKIKKLQTILQSTNIKRIRMIPEKNQSTDKEKKTSCNLWTKEEDKKLLEFILINPYDIIDGPQQRGKMIPELCKYIKSNKTETNCKKKIKNLLDIWKTYGQIVDALKKSTKVDDKWISERVKSLQSRGIDYLELRKFEIKKIQINKVKLEVEKWSEQEIKQLLEYVLLYPQRIYQLHKGNEVSKQLHSHINSAKTQLQSYGKLSNLIKTHQQYDDIVKYLTERTKVNEKWIEERKNKMFINAIHYESEIKKLRQDSSILEKAHKLLISNFDFHQAFAYRQKFKPNEVLLNFSPTTQNANLQLVKSCNHLESMKPNQQNQMLKNDNNLIVPQKTKPVPEERIIKLRYCLFLAKYQKQFEQKSRTYMAKSFFQNMKTYIQVKSEQDWRHYHQNCMIKEHNNIQNIISKHLQKIFVKPEQLEYEITRIENFYNEDFMEEMNAFMKKAKLELKSSDQEIRDIIQVIKQELIKLSQNQIGEPKKSQAHQKDNESNNTQENSIEKISRPKIIFKFTTNFDITLQKIKDEQKPDKTKKKSSTDRQKVKILTASKQLFMDSPSSSKKERLKQKKKAKQQTMRVSLVSDSELYEESMGIINQKYECQKCDDQESQSFSFDYQGQSMSDSLERSNKQNGQNGSKQDWKDHTVKKRGIFAHQSKIPIQSNNSNNNEQKIVEQPKTANSQQMKRQWHSWSLSERIKVGFFLIVNIKKSLKGFYHKQSKILKQLMDYVGTQKSRVQHTSYLQRLKENHQNDLPTAIESEVKRLQMSKELLNHCKELGDRYKGESSVQIGKNTLALSTYPIIMIDPCFKRLETEIESLIRKGPFVEAKLEFHPDNIQASTKQLNQAELVEANVINISLPLSYSLRVKIHQRYLATCQQKLEQKKEIQLRQIRASLSMLIL